MFYFHLVFLFSRFYELLIIVGFFCRHLSFNTHSFYLCGSRARVSFLFFIFLFFLLKKEYQLSSISFLLALRIGMKTSLDKNLQDSLQDWC